MRFWSKSQAAIVSVLLLTGCGDTAARSTNVQGSDPGPSPTAANPVDADSTSRLSPTGGSTGNDKPPTEKEINALVQQLVSPNHAPDLLYATATYPKGYDHEAQTRVWNAWCELSRIGIRAFPYLIEHFDDDRYCFTEDAGPVYCNWTVGHACSDIFICHLQPYDFVSHFALSGGDSRFERKRPYYWVHYNLRTSAGAKLWWETRKDKSLRELQIETLEWVIAEEAKTPAIYSDLERAYLNDELTTLRARKTPLPPYVPWSQ